jgi:electron transport complex protein RnfE
MEQNHNAGDVPAGGGHDKGGEGALDLHHEEEAGFVQTVLVGIFKDNTIFRLAISLCPVIAVTNSLRNGFMMGAAVLFVQVMVNINVSLLKNFIHPRIRIPIYMIIISSWVTITDMTMAAFFRDVYKQMGLYIQLIVAFASILARADSFASKHKVKNSFYDGIGMGLGFMFAMVVISFFRELLGKGTLWGLDVVGTKPMLIMLLPTGGFLAVGMLMGFFNWIDIRFYGGKGAGGASGH